MADDQRGVGPGARSARALLIGFALAALIVAVFAPIRNYGFAGYDDPGYVTENDEVQRGLTWSGTVWALTTTTFANWHPLTWLSHMADVELYGLDAGKHHLTNLLIHVLNTVLLYGWLIRVTRAVGPSAFVAGLFAVHPLHVEPVAWIAERKELLCAFFWMLSMWAYVFYVERPQLRRFLLVVSCFALGLMAKPMLVTLPFALILLDIWPLGRAPEFRSLADESRAARSKWFELFREKLPLLALSFASSVITFVAQKREGMVTGLEDVPFELRTANVAVSYVTYIATAIWPSRLAVLYPYPRSLPEWEVIGAVLLLIGITALVLRAAREHSYLLVGWLWYLGTLVPVIGFVQVGSQSRADRYTYIPLIGLFIIVAWGSRDLASDWAHRKWLLRGGATAAIVACAVVARAQVAHWQDTITPWTHTIEVTSAKAVAHNNLGVELGRLGKADEAFSQFREAARIEPRYADAHYNMANHLLAKKQFAEAHRHYSEAIRTLPDWAKAHFGLAVCLVAEGKLDAAVREMTRAVELEPENASFRFNLAVMLLGQGKRAAAASHLETALALDPNHSGARRELEALRRRQEP